ncbi:MAG: hypothetical protein K5978_07210, partial [Campylobacter sp.]|nr:hypothetical protein [Campylobacter sp.]
HETDTNSNPTKELANIPENIDGMVEKIQKIYSFDGTRIPESDQYTFVLFKSTFEEFYTNGNLNINNFKKALQQGDLDLNQIEDGIRKIWPLINKTTIQNLTDPNSIALSRVSETELVQDLRQHFENKNGNLARKQKSFRDIVNHAQRRDGDINLSFPQSFFDLEFDPPYRKLSISEIYQKWGVNNTIVVGAYTANCSLEEKLKSIFRKWFPNCKAEDIDGETPIIDYIFKGQNRFSALINSKRDDFSPKLLVRILYSFEEEAKRLNISPEDLDINETKHMTPDQDKLRKFWLGAYDAFTSMAPGCCVQVQQAINKIAEHYDVYQASAQETEKTSSSKLNFDKKFCQMWREEATNKTVGSCPATQSGSSAPDFARLIKSIFTPLVNIADSGYHTEKTLKNFSETYQSLAIKWKDSISSFDLIKNLFKKIYIGMSDLDKRQFEKFEELPVNFDDFVSIIKSIDKSERSVCETEITNLYKVFRDQYEKNKDSYTNNEVSDLENMGKWINRDVPLTFKIFITLITTTFCDVVDLNSKIYKFVGDIDNARAIIYIIHLANSNIIKIDG